MKEIEEIPKERLFSDLKWITANTYGGVDK
jgi:hypothetical protein